MLELPHMKKSEKEISVHRKEVEGEIIDLLKKTKSHFTLDDVKRAIFNENDTDDMQKVIAMFDDGNLENLSNVIETVTDAWNYFPHKILDGLSPEEKLLGYEKSKK
jgi:hypothetical protein